LPFLEKVIEYHIAEVMGGDVPEEDLELLCKAKVILEHVNGLVNIVPQVFPIELLFTTSYRSCSNRLDLLDQDTTGLKLNYALEIGHK
jgi:hypothetical protein